MDPGEVARVLRCNIDKVKRLKAILIMIAKLEQERDALVSEIEDGNKTINTFFARSERNSG